MVCIIQYKKFGMKSPDQLREEEDKRLAEYYALTSKVELDKKPASTKQPEKKPDPKPEPPRTQPRPAEKPVEVPVTKPPPTIPIPAKKDVSPAPIQTPPTNTTPRTNPPPISQPDFTNFFGGVKV